MKRRLLDPVLWWRDPVRRGSKYEKWYDALIKRARKRGQLNEPGEWHHVIPKSLGGQNSTLVHLTYREHFVAHLLLAKLARPGEARIKMLHAIGRMANSDGGTRFSSWEYSVAAKAKAKAAQTSALSMWEDEERRSDMGARVRKLWEDKEYRDNLVAKRLELWRDEKYREKFIGENHISKRPDIRAKRADYMRQNNPMRNPEILEGRSGEKHHFYGKKRPEITGDVNPSRRPEIRAILSEQKLGDKNPAKRAKVRAKIGQSIKEFNAANPEAVAANPRFRGGKHTEKAKQTISAASRGSANPYSKLTEEIVLEIRALEGKMKRPDVAKKFGLNVWHVRDIQKRRCWTHI